MYCLFFLRSILLQQAALMWGRHGNQWPLLPINTWSVVTGCREGLRSGGRCVPIREVSSFQRVHKLQKLFHHILLGSITAIPTNLDEAIYVMKGHADREEAMYRKGHSGDCMEQTGMGSPGLAIPPEDITERIPVSRGLIETGKRVA